MSKNHFYDYRRITLALLAATALVLGAFGLARAGALAPPAVVDLEPDPEVHTAPVDASVSVTFDQDMDPAAVNPQTFAVHARQTGWLAETFSVNGGTITLDPLNNLHAGELVQASATTGLRSTGGEAPLEPTVWQFTTQPWGGNAAFHEHQILNSAASRDAALGDLDGDSDLDAFTTSCHGYTRVYHNDGSGTFAQTQSFNYAYSCMLDAELGDLDGDGDLDAVLIDYSSIGNKVLWNNGDGTFTDSGQEIPSTADTYAELGDLDGDSDLDLFVAAGGYDPGTLRVWRNDGKGVFTLVHDFDSAYGHMGMALGDLDQDGDLDAFTSGWYDSYNKVWLNDGTGAYSEAQAIPLANTISVLLGDLDNDGDLDAYFANGADPYDFPDEVWWNDGRGHFTDSGQNLNTVGAAFPALGDLDADGDLDVYASGAWNTPQPDEVWANDGVGGFTLYRIVDENYPGGIASLGDLDGDGNLDAFTGGLTSAYGYQVYLNGDWTQAKPVPHITTLAATIHCPDDPDGFYILGGYDAYGSPLDDLRHYDAATDAWEELHPIPYKVSSSVAACHAGKIYAAFGWDLYIYDIASDTWEEGPPPPRSMDSGGMGAWNGSLYAVGGYNPSTGDADGRISRYNIAAETWELEIGVMPNPVFHAGWAQVGPYLYAAGGGDDLINIAETYRYDMSSNSWEQGPDLASPRWTTGLVATGSRLYALGGVYQWSEPPYEEVYYQELSAWPAEEWTEFDDPLPLAYGGMSTVCTEAVTGGEIWSTGGSYIDEDGDHFLDTNLYHPAEACIHYGLSLAPESLEGEGVPGGTVDYELTITNTGSVTDYFTLDATSLWPIIVMSQTLPVEIGPLGAGEGASIAVTVAIPPDAEGGDADTAVITAASISNPAEKASSSLTTTYPAVYAPDMVTETPPLSGYPGEVVTYTLHLSNQGNTTDTYDLSVSGNEWEVTLPVTQTTLAMGEYISVTALVAVPEEALAGEVDTATITATSQGDPDVSDSAELITTADWRKVYLPVIIQPAEE